MAKFIYVDNSNVFIEGQRVAAVRKRHCALNIDDANAPTNFRIHEYRLDFGKLYQFFGHKRRYDGHARHVVWLASAA